MIIFSNDDRLAHVHVFGDGQATINLLGAGGVPEPIWADAMSRGSPGAPRVTDQQAFLLARWGEIHEQAR